MFNPDEEKIECAIGNSEFCFWQGKKAENAVFLILTSAWRDLFFSNSWYCQMFFINCYPPDFSELSELYL